MAGLPFVTVAPGVLRPLTGASRAAFATSRALKNLYRAAWQAYDRTLHPLRHLVARRRLSSARRPRRILVVCYGNVCRSPYFQAVIHRELADVEVTSAGFVGSGRPVPSTSLELARERGLDLSGHRSQLVSLWRVTDADLVVVMDPEQATRIFRSFPIKRNKIVVAPDLAPRFETSRAIQDPWNRSVEAYIASFDQLDRCAATLVRILGTQK